MLLGGLGRWWEVMLDLRVILASVFAVWVVLRGLGRRWVFIIDCKAILASA